MKIILAFATSGNFIFGPNSMKFQSVPRSILQCLLMLISDNNDQSLVNIDPLMGTLYYLIFMVSSLNK